jgi:primosomal protein N''
LTKTNSNLPVIDNDGRSMTEAEWRAKHKLSKSSHYKLKRLGRAPKALHIPGTTISRITPKADHEWEAQMEELVQQEAARLEQQRRAEQARAAGKAAAQSPRHVSKRGPRHRASPNAQ